MTYEEQQTVMASLSLYDDWAMRLGSDAEIHAVGMYSPHNYTYDEDTLTELRGILRDTSERIFAALKVKLSKLQPDVDVDLLKTFGLDDYSSSIKALADVEED